MKGALCVKYKKDMKDIKQLDEVLKKTYEIHLPLCATTLFAKQNKYYEGNNRCLKEGRENKQYK